MKLKVLSLLLLILIISITSLQANSPWLGRDKAMHFLTSAYLTYWNYGWSHDVMEQSENSSLFFSISLTSFLGFGKEFSDQHIKKTGWSWQDMAYNGAGIVFGLVLVKNLR